MNESAFLETKCSLSFEEFSHNFPLYGRTVCATFHIVRDIIIKREVENISIVDGSSSGLQGYMIRCVTSSHHRQRVILPWSSETEIDLLWLNSFIKKSVESNTEVYICIHTPESVIYQLVETELF